MTVTYGFVYSARVVLQELMGRDFPVGVSLTLVRLMHEVQDAIDEANDVRENIIESTGGEVTPEGVQWEDEDDEEEAQERFDELLEQEVTLDARPLTREEIEEMGEISPAIIIGLGPMADLED